MKSFFFNIFNYNYNILFNKIINRVLENYNVIDDDYINLIYKCNLLIYLTKMNRKK